jgi:hypothetical protein
MSEKATVGSIDIHQVNKDNVSCKLRQHDNFCTIQIDLGMTTITLYTKLEDVAAIRRILGGW